MKLLANILAAFFLLLGTIVVGCAPSAETMRRETTDRFRAEVDSILADSVFEHTIAALKIVSLDRNEVLYSRNSALLLRPASNLKLLTTATTLITLEKGFQLRTELYADTSIQGDTLHGNVYIRGYGDPDFTSAQLDTLLDALPRAGVRVIDGRIVGDAGYFDTLNWGAGWMWDDEPSGYAAYNSPLTINSNCVSVTAAPDSALGGPVHVTIDPATSYVGVENNAVTGPDTCASTLIISRRYRERENIVTVTGTMPRRMTPQTDAITVWNPERYFLTLASECLTRKGVAVSGIGLDSVPPSARLIAVHLQPLDSMIVFLNKISDNLSAENSLKIIGARVFGPPGTTIHGISVVKRALEEFGIDSTAFLMVDGSGVSHYNLVTPDIYIQLLRGMYFRKDLFDLYEASLPIAGVDGSLENRMRGTIAQGSLHAKTGSISGVSTLAGYVRTADGEMLAFSMMMQNFIGSADPYLKAQDAIGVLMAGLKGMR